MGLKKRSKVSAEFSMSSLTDIIFLLLIFFMLTSNLVSPNALNLKLPGSGTPPPSNSKSETAEITIKRDGTYRLDGSKLSKSRLASTMRDLKRKGGRDLSVIIAPEKGAPVEAVVPVMDNARKYNINAILAADQD